ncbi:Bug family tripartite tricarboxylate transporter substrate binding protein [Roseomonas sp. BN140053]|uniref:Bug family tripartite tricarboxylate transporter substrate binding protein n=1 Tax=Roseomonas sp. BN140053 TaxID=3391898 RepID=UPI0039ECAB5B
MILRRSALALGLAALGRPLAAQESFPNRPVRIVLPYGPGGFADISARIVAERMRAAWPQPVVVENQAGAGGNIGAAAVARAAPDGHTLMIASPGPIAFNQVLYRNLPYDPAGFVPISTLLRVPNLIAVGPSVQAGDVLGLVAAMRQEPGRFTYASNGAGSTPHLTAELFSSLTGTKLSHIPYSSAPQALTDVMAGRVDMMFANVAAVLSLLRAGKLRALAIADTQRSAQLPELPTAREAGLDGLVSTAWFGLVAPPRTPPAIVEQIGAVVRASLHDEQARKTLTEAGADPVGNTPEEALAFTRAEARLWGDVIRQAGITAE